MIPKTWRGAGLAAGLLGLALSPLGCGQPTTTPDGGLAALSGNVTIDGSSTVYPLSESIASAFQDEYPNVQTSVGVSGTGDGFKRFVAGETDISDASRPIEPGEFRRAAENGIAFLELPVALDGLTIVVNPENDWVQQLTIDQLRQIYVEESAAQTWSDVNPDWPDQPIKVYSPGTASGTFDYFHEVMGEEKALRPDMSTNEDDNVLVTGVSGDQYAIGYFGASYYYNNRDKLRAVPIVNPETGEAVLPTEENVKGGRYVPFSRPLFIYVKEASLSRPEVRKFVEFYLDHAAEHASRVDYVPLSDDISQRAREFYENRRTGTVFVTAEGETRSGRLPELYVEENLTSIEEVK